MKMISSNPMPLFSLMLVIFVIFSVSLTETLQLAEGLVQVGSRLIYELDVGESQILQWGMINSEDEERVIQFYAEGSGSELLHFEEFVTMAPGEFRNFDFIVVVPKDHPDNIEYQITLNAMDKGHPLADGETGIQVQMVMQQNPRIYIGDNPVYTYESPEVQKETTTETKVPAGGPPALAAGEGIPTGETLQEKLARIAAANQGVKVDDDFEETFEQSFEEEAVPEYLPEPTPDPEPIADKIECDFFAWLLSLFGLAKC